MKRMSQFIMLLGIVVAPYDHVIFAQDEYVQEFGVSMGKAVDSGAVFLDGEYVMSPYMISRRGLALYVNDREIKRPRRHMETCPDWRSGPLHINGAETPKAFPGFGGHARNL